MNVLVRLEAVRCTRTVQLPLYGLSLHELEGSWLAILSSKASSHCSSPCEMSVVHRMLNTSLRHPSGMSPSRALSSADRSGHCHSRLSWHRAPRALSPTSWRSRARAFPVASRLLGCTCEWRSTLFVACELPHLAASPRPPRQSCCQERGLVDSA